MRQIAIVAVTTAILCLPVPAIAQGFQFGSERGLWDTRSDFPCYRWTSHSSSSHFHNVDQYQKPRGARSDFYSTERNWDAGKYWLGLPSEKRRPRCIGLWESQR